MAMDKAVHNYYRQTKYADTHAHMAIIDTHEHKHCRLAITHAILLVILPKLTIF